MANGSVWNPENIKDVAESVGIGTLSTEVVDHLTRDVEFRLAQVLEEALKFMRHAKRTTLFTEDIAEALRALEVEPLYGYESTRPLKFGEASIGPGQPLYYLDDEEADFEKLINMPLPKVPREISFTAHWLAVEGVQPKIPQNPTAAGAARNDLLPKGPGTNPQTLAATAGADNVTMKPLIKHVLSKELQIYFDHICAALLDESNDEYRAAALSSLSSDPGLHQLVPYFVQFIAEKVTHNLKNIHVLTQMLHLVSALLSNPHLHIAPYVASLIPPVLTCLVGKRLGPSASSTPPPDTAVPSLPPHYRLRDLAASVMQALTRKNLVAASPTVKPRLARTLMRHLLPHGLQPLGTYYGAVLGLCGVAGAEGVRVLLIPNLEYLNEMLNEALSAVFGSGGEDAPMVDESVAKMKKREVDMVVEAVVGGLEMVEREMTGEEGDVNGNAEGSGMDVDLGESVKAEVKSRLGELIGERVIALGRKSLVDAVLARDGIPS